MNRYSPNPHLIAPSTEQRMVLAADGDYVLHSDALALKAQRDALDRALHELASANGWSDKDVQQAIKSACLPRCRQSQRPESRS